MTIKKNYSVTGMHCASCAYLITQNLSKIEGVRAKVNYATEEAIVETSKDISLNELNSVISPMGYKLIDPVSESEIEKIHLKELSNLKQQLTFGVPIAVLVFTVMIFDFIGLYQKWIEDLLMPIKPYITLAFLFFASLVIFYFGKIYLRGVLYFFKTGKANMDTLIGIGTFSAYLYSLGMVIWHLYTKNHIPDHTYFDVTIIVLIFVTIGKYLEKSSKAKTGDALKSLMQLQSKTATVLQNEIETEVEINKLKKDDLVIVKPGGRIPVDGTIQKGETYIDESMLTGEPTPVHKTIGEVVSAGTFNTNGSILVSVTHTIENSVLSKIISLVKEAQNSKAPIGEFADNVAIYFVPTVLTISFASFLIFGIFGLWEIALNTALSVLVIACPCALGLATPMASVAGMGKAATQGILFKNATIMQIMANIDTIVLDKTGTLTEGKPKITKVECDSDLRDEFDTALVSLESLSEHPIASAVKIYRHENNIKTKEVASFFAHKGKGIAGKIENEHYFAGTLKFLKEQGISLSFDTKNENDEIGTPIYVSNSEKILGTAFFSDPIKNNAKEEISKLKKMGIKVLMMTGDIEKTAKNVADSVGIENFASELLPGDKLSKIKELQKNGQKVAMVGDGINDAPALAQANIGIAMATGNDIAIETSGVTILHGDLRKVTGAVVLAKNTLSTMKQNLFLAFSYNVLAIPVAAGALYPFFGILLHPIIAGVAMTLSSVSVVLNSLRAGANYHYSKYRPLNLYNSTHAKIAVPKVISQEENDTESPSSKNSGAVDIK